MSPGPSPVGGAVPPRPLALVICVNFHCEEDIRRFVAETLDQRGSDRLRVVVVDNGSDEAIDPPLASLADQDFRVSVLSPGANLGYYGGAAWGLQKYMETMTLPEWIVVSNPDIQFSGGDFFECLLRLYSFSPQAVIAPAIFAPELGGDQNPYMIERPSRFRIHFYKWIFRFYITCLVYHLLTPARTNAGRLLRAGLRSQASSIKAPLLPRAIYAPHGSFVLFHRSYFAAGGDIKHGARLYGEELFVAESARRLGLKVVYDPRLQVLHRRHSTTQALPDTKMAAYLRESSAYVADTFFPTASRGLSWG